MTTNIPQNKAHAVFQNVNIFISANNEGFSLKLLQHTYAYTLILYKLMTLNGKSSRSCQGYIGLAKCCYISKTDTSLDAPSDKTRDLSA